MAEKLFTEFPPVSTKEWEEVIVKDLKGADYDKKLVWKTYDGFPVRPYYRAEDLADVKYLGKGPGEFPFARGTKKENRWFITETVCCCDNDFAGANKKALSLLTKGVESLNIFIDDRKPVEISQFATLLNGIPLEKVPVNFRGCLVENDGTLANFLKYADSTGIAKDAVRAAFDYGPVATLTRSGSFNGETFEALAKKVRTAGGYKNVKVISVDAAVFNNCGASTTQELACALSQGSEYLSRLSDLGLEIPDVANKMFFNFAVGNSYFFEIAKFRAARMLWANIIESYGCTDEAAEKMTIFATTSEYNQTVYDAYVNMLRGTTETMSAVLAGVDYMEVLPYDYAFRVPDDFSKRIARNVQNILKEESRFDKVVDPAAGSYYIETITVKLAENAWNLFRKREEAGGYVAEFKRCNIQNDIRSVSDKRDKNIATRRETILGTNQFPNFLEKAGDCITKEIVSREIPTVNGIKMGDAPAVKDGVEPLRPYRAAEAFEALRLATDRSGKEPKAFMLTFGNLAMCRARAQFSSNFFAVAGIRIIDNNRFSTIGEGVEEAVKSGAEIVVACSSDEEYADAVPEIARLIGDRAILTVAGDPPCKEDLQAKGIENFISVRSNVLETLKGYQEKLGIKPL